MMQLSDEFFAGAPKWISPDFGGMQPDQRALAERLDALAHEGAVRRLCGDLARVGVGVDPDRCVSAKIHPSALKACLDLASAIPAATSTSPLVAEARRRAEAARRARS